MSCELYATNGDVHYADLYYQSIYLNDDMYFLRDHVVADYWSAPWGLVMRPQKHIPVPALPDLKPINGEWQPLRHTNHIISRRFG